MSATGPGRATRVTFVVPDLAAGGAEHNLVSLLERWAEDPSSGVEGRVVCLGKPGVLFDRARAVAPARALGHTKRQAAASLVALVRELRATRPDVVVTRGYSAEALGRVAAVLAGVGRTVVWVHHCEDTEPRGRVRSASDRVLDRVTSTYLGVAHAQVPYLVDELGYPPQKVRIVHNGVDPAGFGRPDDVAGRDATRRELGAEPDEPLVAILAALRPEKDHELFLAAAREVLARVPDARFAVVGDVGDGGVRRAELAAEAERLGIADRVVLTGYRSDVSRILAAVDVVVLTSYTVECLPVSLLEAMASGRPVVSTDVGGVGEIVVEGLTGHLVPARRVEPLADRLVDLLRDPARRKDLGEAGRARVRELFTLEDNAAGVAAVLHGQDAGAGTTPARAAQAARPARLTAVMDTTAVGGAELVTLRTFAALDRDLVVPRLVCLREEGPLADDFRAAGVEVVALHRRGRADVRTLPRLVAALRRDQTDAVLVAHHHRASLALGRVAARLAGVPVTLVAPHDMDLVALGGRVLPAWTVGTLRWASALVLLAESQRRYLHEQEGVGRHRWSRTREVVVPNGIVVPPAPVPGDREAARDLLGLPRDAFVVGIVARLSAQKAHHVLLAAFARLATDHPAAQLVLVGGGEREAELRSLADELGIAARTHLTGVRRDVAALLPGFDVACLSSVHEAAPLVVLEAMAAGVPVVATDCGALREMVDDDTNGLIVPVGDVDALARALDRLAADPATRTAMGAAARRRAETAFDVESTARGYTELLRALLTRGGRWSRGAQE